MQVSNNKQQLGLFSLIMIAVVSVDSLRNLPISAQYGFSLITFYLVASIAFFIPVSWLASKLSVSHAATGGSYVWIEKAYGPSFGYLSIWLQWVYNIIWYPTIFAFINSTLASLIAPAYQTNQWFILLTSLAFFWVLTFVHCFGIRAFNWISTFGAIIGTLIPMFIIMSLAIFWLYAGNPSATTFSWSALLPDEHSMHNLGFFSNILFGLLGLEIISMHAGNIADPKKTYPKAFIISSLLILFTTAGTSLALCILVPYQQIGLISGVMNVFDAFFKAYHLPFSTSIIAVCIIIGGLAIASSWMIGLARGLHVALCSINAPQVLQKCNRYGMPANTLILQACIYTVLVSAFLLFPDINNSYWVLSALTAQFALLYYILLFFAGSKLLRQNKLSKMNYFLSYFFPMTACIVCAIGIVVGFIPPEQIATTDVVTYETLMVIGFFFIATLPLWLRKLQRRNPSKLASASEY